MIVRWSGTLNLLCVDVSRLGDGVGSGEKGVIAVKPAVSLHVFLGGSASVCGADLTIIAFCGVGVCGSGASSDALCCVRPLGPNWMGSVTMSIWWAVDNASVVIGGVSTCGSVEMGGVSLCDGGRFLFMDC